jgi:hypothetical protein
MLTGEVPEEDQSYDERTGKPELPVRLRETPNIEYPLRLLYNQITFSSFDTPSVIS